MAAKIIEHPTTRLVTEIEKQAKVIDALKVDVLVLKDLLMRTIRMLARSENQKNIISLDKK